jgi:hypothetical protein
MKVERILFFSRLKFSARFILPAKSLAFERSMFINMIINKISENGIDIAI